MTDIEIPTIEPVSSPPTSTPWVPLWPLAPSMLGELAYGSFATTINVPTSGVTPIVSAGSVQCDGTPLIIEFFSPIALAAANGTITAQLYVDGVGAGIMGQVNAGAATDVHSMFCRVRYVPTPGAHTFEIRATASTGTGQYIAGAGYTPGFIRVSPAVPIAAPVRNPSYGTSFPASPPDGQEHILVDSLTNPTYQWRFRYNAGSASAYKWEFIGGAPKGAGPQGDTTLAGGSSDTPLAGGPTFVLPRSGDYQVQWGVSARKTTATGGALITDIWDGVSGGVGRSVIGTTPLDNLSASATFIDLKTAMVAARTLAIRVAAPTAGAGGQFTQGWLNVTPVRVA